MMTKLPPIVLLATLLAGCSRSQPDAPAPTDTATTSAAPVPAPVPSPVPTPTASPAAKVSAAPPPPAVGANEQMLDDASATGMTARVEREHEGTIEPPPLSTNGSGQASQPERETP